jgi:hypothetical protein
MEARGGPGPPKPQNFSLKKNIFPKKKKKIKILPLNFSIFWFCPLNFFLFSIWPLHFYKPRSATDLLHGNEEAKSGGN